MTVQRLTRVGAAAVLVGGSMFLATAAPAYAQDTGGAAYPPGNTTNINISFPINITISGNTFSIVIGGAAPFSVVNVTTGDGSTVNVTTDVNGNATHEVSTNGWSAGDHEVIATSSHGTATGHVTVVSHDSDVTQAAYNNGHATSGGTGSGHGSNGTSGSGNGYTANTGTGGGVTSYTTAGSSGNLADTGANGIVPLSLAGGILVLGGAGAVAVTRRRRIEG